MREKVWLFLRGSSLVRSLAAIRIFATPMRIASYLLVPSSGQKRMRVQAGPAKGLLFDLNPRWEHDAWDGSYELPALEAFLQLLATDMIVYDVGAGVGFYALLAARARACVIAFEPDPENAEALARHIDVNHVAKRVRIVREAVFSHTGHVKLRISKGIQMHRNTSALLGKVDSGTTFEVVCTTLDDFVKCNPVPKLVKIDVEGAESGVLQGADYLFRRYHPRLLCEIHDDSNAAFVSGWLNERGYNCRWVEKEELFPRHLLAWPQENHMA
jgi:FkbM family methyltransferase